MPRQRPQALRSSVFQMGEFWLYMTIALVVMILMDLNFVDFPTGEGGRLGSCSVSGSSCWTRVDLVISGWWFQSFLYFHLFHPKLLHNTAHIPDISQVGLLFRRNSEMGRQLCRQPGKHRGVVNLDVWKLLSPQLSVTIFVAWWHGPWQPRRLKNIAADGKNMEKPLCEIQMAWFRGRIMINQWMEWAVFRETRVDPCGAMIYFPHKNHLKISFGRFFRWRLLTGNVVDTLYGDLEDGLCIYIYINRITCKTVLKVKGHLFLRACQFISRCCPIFFHQTSLPHQNAMKSNCCSSTTFQ